jgi:hypothetical protein
MSLSCGGRGPCCHISYPHRHCEHCDVVIPTYHQHAYYSSWWSQPYYGNVSIGGPLSSQLQNAQTYGASTIVHEEGHN